MASVFCRSIPAVKCMNDVLSLNLKKCTTPILFGQVRTKVTTETGAVLQRPKKVPFGIPRVILTVLPGLYLGATISKEGAAFLEENDIFVPADDDDED